MGRKKDRFWEYADELNGRFKCKFCNKEFAGGISRVKSHLSGVKGRDVDICQNAPVNVRVDAWQAIGSPGKKVNGNICVGAVPSSTTSLACTEGKKIAVDQKLVKFLIASGFWKEASQSFVEFVKAVSEFGPNYELPDLHTRDELFTECEREILKYVRDVKESWIETGCTLMITCQEDSEERHVFAYCPKGMVLLTSGSYLKTGYDIFEAIDEVGAPHVVQIIDSGYASKPKIVELITEHCPRPRELFTSPCPVSVIQSIVSDIGLYVDWIQRLVVVGQMIFKYMKKYSMELERKISRKLKEYKRLGYMRPMTFSDDLLLLFLVVELEAELVAVVQSLDASSHWQDVTNWVAGVTLNTKFWILGKEVFHIFDILFQVACLANSKVPAFPYLYESVIRACNAIDECSRKDPTKYEKIKLLCDNKLWSMINPLHAAACFLNPSIMCGEIFKEDSLMKEGIDYMAHNFFVETKINSFVDQVHLYRTKDPSIFSATAVEKLKTFHPAVWWRYFGDSVPLLQWCAIRTLSQQCGVPLKITELANSSDILSDRKRINLLMMERFNEAEPSSMEPIDLDKLTWVCEFVKQETSSDFSDLIYEKTSSESVCYEKDPFHFWLKNEHGLKYWDITEQYSGYFFHDLN